MQIEAFLNRNKTQAILGIDKNHRNFTSSSLEIGLAFNYALDLFHQTQLFIAELLERGMSFHWNQLSFQTSRANVYADIDVLIYVGTYDFIWYASLHTLRYFFELIKPWLSNWIGNLAWAEALEWPGKEEFNRQEFRPWIVDNKQAGRYKTSQRFTFATVEGL